MPGADPQTYGIGIKELWEIDSGDQHEQGLIVHTLGWPLDRSTYGGSFLYHLEDNQVAVGFVVGLDYTSPHLSPFEEFQRFKTHPKIRPDVRGRTESRLRRAGDQRRGSPVAPEDHVSGRAARGRHCRLPQRSEDQGHAHRDEVRNHRRGSDLRGARSTRRPRSEITDYRSRLEDTWLWDELHRVRNLRPSFRWGLWGGMLYSGLDTYLLRGRAPWTLRHHADHAALRRRRRSARASSIPRPDGVVSFDRNSSVFLSNTNHEEDQPVHLTLKDDSVPIAVNLAEYDAPEQRYCPAGVYEIVGEESGEPSAADQRAELRTLQDLRHQGSDAEHPLGHPGGRRRPQLSEHVALVPNWQGYGAAKCPIRLLTEA